jgi:hypothetical protein
VTYSKVYTISANRSVIFLALAGQAITFSNVSLCGMNKQSDRSLCVEMLHKRHGSYREENVTRMPPKDKGS